MAIATGVLSVDRADPSLARGGPPLAVASERCKGCELCVTACPHGVLALDVGVVNRLGYHPIRLTDANGCTSCAICAKVCPDAVFTVYLKPKEA